MFLACPCSSRLARRRVPCIVRPPHRRRRGLHVRQRGGSLRCAAGAGRARQADAWRDQAQRASERVARGDDRGADLIGGRVAEPVVGLPAGLTSAGRAAQDSGRALKPPGVVLAVDGGCPSRGSPRLPSGSPRARGQTRPPCALQSLRPLSSPSATGRVGTWPTREMPTDVPCLNGTATRLSDAVTQPT